MEDRIINCLDTLDSFIINQNNNENVVYLSDIPEICKGKSCMLGVDEAGRGPVLGPMVYGISYCPLDSIDVLKELGCADSKQLTEEKREEVFEALQANSCVGWATESIAPNIISGSMNRRSKCSLNEVSMDSAINLIRLALTANVKVTNIYVDTVGPPDKYQDKLQKLFPNIEIVVSKKADSIYPIVSAASICAKVTRDHSLKVWKFPEGLTMDSKHYGSGYPGDPVTKRFLTQNIDLVFGYPRLVRFSWATAENALYNKAFDVTFESEDAKKSKKDAVKLTQFFKGTMKTPIGLHRRQCKFLKDRSFKQISSL